MIKVIYVIIFIVAGIIGGNGAVYVFNRLPAKWLSDYGEEPKEDVLQRQRINSTPWKALFSCILVLTGVYLSTIDPLYAAAAVIVAFLLILISIADAKYMIVPDEICIALAVCACGFVRYHGEPLDIMWGGLAGAGIMLLIAYIGKLVYKRDAMGMGDVKLMCAVGLMVGLRGVIYVFIGASVFSAMAFGILLLRKRIKKDDYQPMGPYIACACLVYILVFWPLQW